MRWKRRRRVRKERASASEKMYSKCGRLVIKNKEKKNRKKEVDTSLSFRLEWLWKTCKAPASVPRMRSGQKAAATTARRLAKSKPLETPMALTKRQKEVLDYLISFETKHVYSPSFEEIGKGLKLTSLATVHKHITTLEKKGFIRRGYNQSRSIEI